MSNQDFLFGADQDFPLHTESTQTLPPAEPWQVLIVDDDESIHQITNLVLKGFQFEGRPLQLLHAYSAKAALLMLEQHQHIAVAIVDVVMESNHAGLDLVKTIRSDLKTIKFV